MHIRYSNIKEREKGREKKTEDRRANEAKWYMSLDADYGPFHWIRLYPHFISLPKHSVPTTYVLSFTSTLGAKEQKSTASPELCARQLRSRIAVGLFIHAFRGLYAVGAAREALTRRWGVADYLGLLYDKQDARVSKGHEIAVVEATLKRIMHLPSINPTSKTW